MSEQEKPTVSQEEYENLQRVNDDLLRKNHQLEKEMEQQKMNIKCSKNKKKRELQIENEALHKERVGLCDEIEDLKKQTQAKEKENEHLLEENLGLHNENDALKQDIQAKEKENEHLLEENLGLHNENDALKQDIQAKEKHREEMTMLHNQRCDELIMAKERAMDNMRQETEILNNKVQDLTRRLKDAQCTTTQLQHANNLLQQDGDIIRKNRQLEKEIEQLKMNIKRSNNKKKRELQIENEALHKERVGLYDVIEDLKKQTQAKEKENEHLLEEKQGLYNENEALKAEIQAKEKHREDMTMLHNQRCDKLTKTRAMDDTLQQTEILNNKVQDLTRRLKDAQCTTAELQHANNLLQQDGDLLRKNRQLEKEMEQLKMNMKRSKNKKKRELQIENEALHKERVGLYDAIEDLKNQTQAKEKENEHLLEENLGLHNENDALKQDIQAKEKENEHLLEENLGLHNENDALKQDIQAKEKHREEMTMLHNQRCDELIMAKERAMDNMRQETEILNNKVQDLTRRLKDAQCTTTQLQHANNLLQQDGDIRKNHQLEKEMEQLKMNIKRSKNKKKRELQIENEALHKERVGLYDVIEDLKKQTQAKEKEIEHLKVKLGLYNENEALKAEIQAKEKHREDMTMLHNQRCDKLTKERAMDDMLQQTEILKNKVQEPTNSLEAAQRTTAELQHANNLLQQDGDIIRKNRQLERDTEEVSVKINHTQSKKIQELQTENECLHKERAGLYDKIEDLKKHTRGKEEEIEYLLKEKGQLYYDIQFLKARLKAKEKDCEIMDMCYVHRLHELNMAMDSGMEDMRLEKEILIGKVQELTNSLEIAQYTNTELQHTINLLQQQISEKLQTEQTRSENEKESLREEIKALKEELSQATDNYLIAMGARRDAMQAARCMEHNYNVVKQENVSVTQQNTALRPQIQDLTPVDIV